MSLSQPLLTPSLFSLSLQAASPSLGRGETLDWVAQRGSGGPISRNGPGRVGCGSEKPGL